MNGLRNILYSYGRSSIVGMDGDMGTNKETSTVTIPWASVTGHGHSVGANYRPVSAPYGPEANPATVAANLDVSM